MFYEDSIGGSGQGFVENISRSGLLLDRCSSRPDPGCKITLRASYFPGSTEVAIDSEVVRQTTSGFAVTFVDLTPNVLGLIEQILPA